MNEEEINTNNNDNKSENNKLKNEVIIHGDDYIENNNVDINDESKRYVVQDLKGGKKRYYIINELFSFDYMKIFFWSRNKK